MPKEQLLEYVRSNLSKGFTPEQIREVMGKHGYTDREIDQIFKSIAEEKLMHLEPLPNTNRINWGFYFLILLGLGTLALAAAFPVVIFSGFGRFGAIPTYLLTIVLGALFGFVLNWGMKLFNESRILRTLTGIVAPLLAVCVIIGVFYGKGVIVAMALEHGPNPINETLGGVHSPLLVSLIFYIAANAFVIIDLVRKKNGKHLFWYPLGLAAYILIWIVTTGLVKGFITSVVKQI